MVGKGKILGGMHPVHPPRICATVNKGVKSTKNSCLPMPICRIFSEGWAKN